MSALNNKGDRVLLPLAAYTTAQIGLPLTRDNYSLGIRCYLNITAASGTGGLKVQVLAYDPVSKASTPLSGGGTAVTATGLYVYELYPGIQTNVSGNVQERTSSALPVTYSVQVSAGDGSSYTYSLACELLQ